MPQEVSEFISRIEALDIERLISFVSLVLKRLLSGCVMCNRLCHYYKRLIFFFLGLFLLLLPGVFDILDQFETLEVVFFIENGNFR